MNKETLLVLVFVPMLILLALPENAAKKQEKRDESFPMKQEPGAGLNFTTARGVHINAVLDSSMRFMVNAYGRTAAQFTWPDSGAIYYRDGGGFHLPLSLVEEAERLAGRVDR